MIHIMSTNTDHGAEDIVISTFVLPEAQFTPHFE